MSNPWVIETLDLKNFRCFPELTLRFHDELTVFVAPNGGGKTAVLDGVVEALRPLTTYLEGRRSPKGFDDNDVRLVLSPEETMEPVTPVTLEARATFLDRSVEWSQERRSPEKSRTST